MNTDHVIAQCCWQSEFDQQDNAVLLQDFISQWSHQHLGSVLADSFDRRCPPHQTWRIDHLELDLGEIDLEDLGDELPARVKDSIEQALNDLLDQRTLATTYGKTSGLQIYDQHACEHALMRAFLISGLRPWWYNGSAKPQDVIHQYLNDEPKSLTRLVRELGQDANVRQRLVWQLNESERRQLVHAIEPWHGKLICDYADQVFAIQASRRLVNTDNNDFQSSTWLVILTHLLVDRGTLFNTLFFIGDTLKLLAQRFRIDYSQLLSGLADAAKQLKSVGQHSHTLLQAICMLDQQNQARKTVKPLPSPSDNDPWIVLQKLLHNAQSSGNLSGQSHHVAELFSQLGEHNPKRMATLLRQEGTSVRVRKGILANFEMDALALIVRIIVPQDYRFVLSHAEQTQVLLNRQQTDYRVLWQVLLSYLLAEKTGYFSRRQFVHNTLVELCNAKQIDYNALLDMLIHASVYKPNGHRFELLMLLQDLKQVALQKQNANKDSQHSGDQHDPSDAYSDALNVYLLTGNTTKGLPSPHGLYQHFIKHLDDDKRFWLHRSPAYSKDQNFTPEQYSERLLTLVQAYEFSDLLEFIAPTASRFCLGLLNTLISWQRMAWLSSLYPIEHSFKLPALILQVLVETGYLSKRPNTNVKAKNDTNRTKSLKFQPARFWARLLLLLQKNHVDIDSLTQQLLACLHNPDRLSIVGKDGAAALSSLQSSISWQKSRALNSSSHAAQDSNSTKSEKPTPLQQLPLSQWPKKDLFAHLSQLLLPPGTMGSTLSMALGVDSESSISVSNNAKHINRQHALSRLWQSIEQNYPDALLPWLVNHPQQSTLLNTLVGADDNKNVREWLLAQVPPALNPPEQVLQQAYTVILHSPLWQGASALLHAQITQCFWQVTLSSQHQTLRSEHRLAQMLRLLCLQLNISLDDCLDTFEQKLPQLPHSVWGETCKLLKESRQNLSNKHRLLSNSLLDNDLLNSRAPLEQDYAGRYLQHPKFKQLIQHLLRYGYAPSGLQVSQPFSLQRALHDLFTQNPHGVSEVLKNIIQEPHVIYRLQAIVSWSWLSDALKHFHPEYAQTLKYIKVLGQVLTEIASPKLNSDHSQALLIPYVLQAWSSNRWQDLELPTCVGAILWQLIQQRTIKPLQIEQALTERKGTLPPPLQQAFDDLFKTENFAVAKPSDGSSDIPLVRGQNSDANIQLNNSPNRKQVAQNSADTRDRFLQGNKKTALERKIKTKLDDLYKDNKNISPLEEKIMHAEANKIDTSTPMEVNNGGMVLLNSYIPMLFERLALVKGGLFVSAEAQRRAVHILQYLVSGRTETPEHYLILNKLLCGIPLYQPVEGGIVLSEQDRETCDGLLQAAISYWPAIGKTSDEGFRGNWLMRESTLNEDTDNWHLIIERRSYDVLLQRSPYSYSIIKFPWMEKSVYVTWPT